MHFSYFTMFGCCRSLSGSMKEAFRVFDDRFETLGEVTKALRKIGMEECGLIFGGLFNNTLVLNTTLISCLYPLHKKLRGE